MTDKLKSRVRERMKQTGESYSAARRATLGEAHRRGLHKMLPRDDCDFCKQEKVEEQ